MNNNETSVEEIKEWLAECDHDKVLQAVVENYDTTDIMKALVTENCFRPTVNALVAIIEDELTILGDIRQALNG